MTNPQQHRQTTGGCFALLHRPTARTPVRWAQSYKITNRSRPARSTNCAARPGRQSGSATIGNISSVMNRHTNGLPTTLSTIRHSGVRIRCGERRGKASAILPSPAGVPSTRTSAVDPVRGKRLQCSRVKAHLSPSSESRWNGSYPAGRVSFDSGLGDGSGDSEPH